jgi:Cu/Ag efflux protein CusF
MKFKLILVVTALIFSLSLQAGDEIAAIEKPSISATQTIKLTTVVDAIDREARTITLKGPEGNTRTINAMEGSNNIDKIEVGDIVNVEYVQHLSIEVLANDGMEPGTGTMAAVARNKEGETPAGMLMETTVTTATVEDINIEANTFKLKWPGGEIKEYEARDPENLKKAAVGDLVVTTYSEAIALSLNEVPAE